MRIICTFIVILALSAASPAFASAVMMEDLTWQEIESDIKSGYTTVIVPTGGTEQNGPHIVLGKHNFILQKTAPAIAGKLGHTLVAPIMPYVPEGDIHPPTGHMKFPGTLSLMPDTFASLLEDTAGSLKQHGFKYICFVGEHGASQPVQARVANKLSAQWKEEGVKVIHVGDYYDNHNGQVEWMKQENPEEQDIEAHGGLADTSEMLVAYPEGIRNNLRGAYRSEDFNKLGTDGSSVNATPVYGKKLLELKIDAAVKQIQKERNQ